MGRGRAEAARQLDKTAGSGERRSAGAISGGSADAFGLDYGMRRRQPGRGWERQCCRRRRGDGGQRANRAAHRARVMFAVFFGLALRVTMSAEQRQQLPFAVIDLGVGAA
jgi:hypothetical protein